MTLDAMLAAGTMTVVASTVAHGVTAAPGRVLYRRVSAGAREGADVEHG